MRMLNGFELAAVAGGAGGARGPQESLISTPIIIYQAEGGGGGCQEPGGSVGDFGSADRDLSALSGFGCVQNVGWQSEVGKWLAGSLGWDMLKD